MLPVAMETESSPVEGPTIVPDGNMLGICKQHLDDEDWKYEVKILEDRSLITCGAQGVNGTYRVIFDIKPDKDTLIIYIKSHIDFPSAHRLELANYLTRANYSLTLGNFELDMTDGEVRYKCSTVVAGTVLSTQMVDKMLHASLVTMDKYYANMVKVAYGAMEAEEANRQIEGDGEGSYLRGALRALVEQRASRAQNEGRSASSSQGDASSLLEALQSVLQRASAGSNDDAPPTTSSGGPTIELLDNGSTDGGDSESAAPDRVPISSSSEDTEPSSSEDAAASDLSRALEALVSGMSTPAAPVEHVAPSQ